MADSTSSRIPVILRNKQDQLIERWQQELMETGIQRDDLMRSGELKQQIQQVISQLADLSVKGALQDRRRPEWKPLEETLASFSRSRAKQGFRPAENAQFILTLKRPLFVLLKESYGADAEGLTEEVWLATQLVDDLALMISDAFQRAREEVILRQQQELLELSTPVVKLWDGVVALPLIGTLDSARTQVVMESLLQMIVETGSQIAIIDITGVPTVDTLVAQHLMKTVAAARLMGAECIISGIRPQIAQTIVHLGVDLSEVTTKASLASAFQVALQKSGLTVVRVSKAGKAMQDPLNKPAGV